MSEEKARLERQVDALSGSLAKKEARLRGSVDALAKASYKLRASFTAEVSWGGAGRGLKMYGRGRPRCRRQQKWCCMAGGSCSGAG
jgi:hypothetical protein